MQRKVTKELPRRNENLDQMIEATVKLVKSFQEHSVAGPAKAEFPEIGAGRSLAVPLVLRMLGDGYQFKKIDLNHPLPFAQEFCYTLNKR